MRRVLASSLLSLLLLTTLVWGGCVSCEQYFMLPGAKSCCAPDGHCKRSAPAGKSSGRECKQIAFDHQKAFNLHIDLPIAAVVAADLPLCDVEQFAAWRGGNQLDPSPPDLQVLHSTFLI